MRSWCPSRRLIAERLEERRLLATLPQLVADLNTAGDWGWFKQLIPVGETILAVAGSEETGLEIWQTDGTAANTRLLHDVWPGPESGLRNADSDLDLFVYDLFPDPAGQFAYFTGVRNGRPFIWQTDAERLTPVLPGPAEIVAVTPRGALMTTRHATPSGYDEQFSTYQDDLYFHHAESNALTFVHAFSFRDDESGIELIGSVDDVVLFRACDNDGDDCTTWRTDGTFDGTGLIFDDRVEGLFQLDGQAYLWSWYNTTLYALDGMAVRPSAEVAGLRGVIGTVQNAVLVQQSDRGIESLTALEPAVQRTLLPVSEGWAPQSAAGEDYYYRIVDHQTYQELWATDGTVEGTSQLFELADADGSFGPLAVTGDRAFLPIYHAAGTTSLLISDGTPLTTRVVTNLPNELSGPRGIDSTHAIVDQLFLVSADPQHGDRVWVTDVDVTRQPALLLDPWPGTASTNANTLEPFGNRVVFRARMATRTRTSDHQLWITDGTLSGTQRLDGPEVEFINRVYATGNTIFFADQEDGSRVETRRLWVSQGTPESTMLLSDSVPELAEAMVLQADVLPDVLVFATEKGNEYGVWITDGTPGGTLRLPEISGKVLEMYAAGGKAYFLVDALTPDEARQWYETDGTLQGTRRIDAEDVPGREITEFEVDGRRFFLAPADGVRLGWWHVREPDGRVASIPMEDGADQLAISEALLVHENIYFTAWDRQRDEYQVYQLDTAERVVSVVSPAPVSGSLGRAGASLLVFYNDGIHGNELSALPLPDLSDVNRDEQINVRDVDALCAALHSQSESLRFDINYDDRVNHQDLSALVSGVLGTGPGDANVDGVFDSADLVRVFQRGEYDDGLARNSVWSEGDWNCDGEFDSADLVRAFQSGRYRAG